MTPPAMAYGFPALLDKSGGCGTRFAQTVLAENSWLVCAARHGSRGLKTKLATIFILTELMIEVFNALLIKFVYTILASITF